MTRLQFLTAALVAPLMALFGVRRREPKPLLLACLATENDPRATFAVAHSREEKALLEEFTEINNRIREHGRLMARGKWLVPKDGPPERVDIRPLPPGIVWMRDELRRRILAG